LAAPEESPTARVIALPWPPGSSTIVLVLSGPILRADVAGLCERVQTLLESSNADLAFCDVKGVADPDVVTVDALARVQLIARRLGLEIRVIHAHGELRDLLALTGLREVVPLCADLHVESRRQVEKREEGGRVEEEGDPDDAAG
jgi:ABC-type transporter Mla MlaB component